MEPIVCLACGGLVNEQASQGDPLALLCACIPSDSMNIPASREDGRIRPASVASPTRASNEAAVLSCLGCGGPLAPGDRTCAHCQSIVSTVRCGACLGWNHAQFVHCQGCGSELSRSAWLGKTTLDCPRCKQALETHRYRDLECDECMSCGGMFLSPSVLHRILKANDLRTDLRLALPKRPALSATDTVQYIPCCMCSKLMNRQQFGGNSGVIVDTCKEHGVWFDGGELERIILFAERGGLERQRAREKQRETDKARMKKMDLVLEKPEPREPNQEDYVKRSLEILFRFLQWPL